MSDAPKRDVETAARDLPDQTGAPPHLHKLRTAIREARLAEADRSDVIVALRDGEIARLDLLREELEEVFAEIPEDVDLIACEILPGNPPRMWVDVLAYVVMGPDKRTYRFLKSVRHGRQVLHETTSVQDMAGRITAYVAHRLIERERALASDELHAGPAATGPDQPASGVVAATEPGRNRRAAPARPQSPVPAPPPSGSGRIWFSLIGFVLGILAGVVGLLVIGYILLNS